VKVPDFASTGITTIMIDDVVFLWTKFFSSRKSKDRSNLAGNFWCCWRRCIRYLNYL
jgi:hypothetical protein